MPCTSTIAGVEDVAVGVVYRLPYNVRGRPRGSVTGKQTVPTRNRGSIFIFGSAAPATPTRHSEATATARAVRARRTALRIARLATRPRVRSNGAPNRGAGPYAVD